MIVGWRWVCESQEGGGGEPPKKIPKHAPNEKEKKEKKERAEMFKKFGSVKRTMLEAMAVSAQLLQTVTGGAPEWKWANNTVMLEPLTKARQEVERFKCSSKFYEGWCLEKNFERFCKETFSMNEIRSQYKKLNGLEELLTEVQTETDMLQNMHQSRQAKTAKKKDA